MEKVTVDQFLQERKNKPIPQRQQSFSQDLHESSSLPWENKEDFNSVAAVNAMASAKWYLEYPPHISPLWHTKARFNEVHCERTMLSKRK